MKISFHKHFAKSYQRCSIKVRQQFKKRLILFVEDSFNPLLENHALHGEWLNFRSININGNYRALYHYTDEDTAEFFIIDTHSNLYD